MNVPAILMKMADFAPGIPDRTRFGNPADLPKGELIPWVVQRHLAERAGPHYDIRFGPDQMHSFATKKELPKPGGKIMVFQQPLHAGSYANFEGTIHEGYGKGTVKKHDQGKIVVQHADENKIKFYVAHKKYPEFYTMVRRSGPPSNPATPRQAKTQGGSWLMINTTPIDAAKFLGGKPEEVGLEKLKYTSVPAEKVDKLFDPSYLVQEKIDGASALYHLLHDQIHAVSYRVSKTGRPILHTYRVFGPGGSKAGAKIPEALQGSILRGEIYGTRKGQAIPPQELSGLLNSSVENSVASQKLKNVQMRNALFDIVRLGKKPIAPGSMGAQERLEKLREFTKVLPPSQFHIPETATTPEAGRKLWEEVTTGKNPRTSEGVIGWPVAPGKKPIKAKATPEADVFVRNVFPGQGRLAGSSAGGFDYSRGPDSPVVGRVGTGFSDETRKNMLADPDSYVGRLARIRSQGTFPSGAHRAPSFISLHEDYPMKSAALILMRSNSVRLR